MLNTTLRYIHSWGMCVAIQQYHKTYITCKHFLRVLAYLGFYILLGHSLMFLVFRWIVDHEVASHLQMKIRTFLVVFFVVLHVSDPDSMTDFTFELRTFS